MITRKINIEYNAIIVTNNNRRQYAKLELATYISPTDKSILLRMLI